MEMVPFFELAGPDQDDWSADSYAAGFRNADGFVSIRFVLPAEMIEPVVLAKAQLSVALSLAGTLTLHADGLSHEALDTASPTMFATRSLASLLDECLAVDSMAMQDNPAADLTALREQLINGLALVDRALAGLQKK
jgi:hypothetical protein